MKAGRYRKGDRVVVDAAGYPGLEATFSHYMEFIKMGGAEVASVRFDGQPPHQSKYVSVNALSPSVSLALAWKHCRAQ